MNRGTHGRMPESELDAVALKRLAARRGLSVEALARRSGLRPDRVRHLLERSSPVTIDDAAVDALARALHVQRGALTAD